MLGLFYCFSCAAGGDLFKFVEKKELCTFPEAVQKIVELMDLDINIENMNDYGRSSGLYNEQKRIEKALALAATYYSHRIASDVTAGTARKHLMARRIRPDTAFKFQIGYAPHPSFSTSSSSNSPYQNKNGEDEVEKERSVPRSITANLTGKYVYVTSQYSACTLQHSTMRVHYGTVHIVLPYLIPSISSPPSPQLHFAHTHTHR